MYLEIQKLYRELGIKIPAGVYKKSDENLKILKDELIMIKQVRSI